MRNHWRRRFLYRFVWRAAPSGNGEYATVAVNEQLEILYIPREKGIQDVGAYYSDGYALAEDEDEQRVIVDREGNIVMER